MISDMTLASTNANNSGYTAVESPFGDELPNPPSYVHFEGCNFLILDAPTDHNLHSYVKVLLSLGIKTMVRTCEATYSTRELKKANVDITVMDLIYPDGDPPSTDLIRRWLTVVEEENKAGRMVAVHCVAGLGRSSVLVAIALMEYARMDAGDAIDLIRQARRGAINQKQALWLQRYQPILAAECCAGYCPHCECVLL